MTSRPNSEEEDEGGPEPGINRVKAIIQMFYKKADAKEKRRIIFTIHGATRAIERLLPVASRDVM